MCYVTYKTYFGCGYSRIESYSRYVDEPGLPRCNDNGRFCPVAVVENDKMVGGKCYERLSPEQRKQVDEWLAKMEADKAAAVTQKATDKAAAQKYG
jgi:hypothetical protein